MNKCLLLSILSQDLSSDGDNYQIPDKLCNSCTQGQNITRRKGKAGKTKRSRRHIRKQMARLADFDVSLADEDAGTF